VLGNQRLLALVLDRFVEKLEHRARTARSSWQVLPRQARAQGWPLVEESSPTMMPTAPEARAMLTTSALVESWATGTAVAPALRIPK
jgi:hypothetical protein